MKKNIWAALLCILFATTLLVSGCSSSGTVSKTTGDSAGKGQETSGKQLEDSESVPEEGILVGSDSFLNEGESEEEAEEEIEDEIEEEPEEKSGVELGEEPEEPGSGEDGSISAKVSGQETKKEETPAGAAAGTVSDDTAASKKETAEAEAKEKQPEEKQEKGKTKEAAAKEDQPKDGSREEGQKENKEKEEKDILKDLQAGLEGEYIPDGFEPEGNYVLIYDSGYTVKTRYSKVGLTYYWESEEFFFKLNKDLPDMKAYVAHMLFNTAEPMSDPGEEVFPYDESYVLYVDLDNGNSYQIAKYSLDRTGRIFVRELFESFRQRFEGTF
ncbi:MAG: hypothetical protein Q4F51_04975 [Sarcina sp.]|nr:hypothetical protein [Sarcina sp.]